MKKIKVAVIGVGYLGKFHAEKYKINKKVDLVGVVDSNKERRTEISKKLNVLQFSNYKEVLPKVDAVSIAVPTNLHYEIGKIFLENGKHVLLEKPFTSTLAQAKTLGKIADSKKIILQIGHLERFNKAFLKLENIIQRPLFIECNRISPFKIRGTEVDVIMDLMIHDLDIILKLNKSNIKNIQAKGIKVLTNKADIANARITFENGCICNLSSSRISEKVERKTRIFQKNAYFSIDYQTNRLDTYTKESNKSVQSIKRKSYQYENNDSLKKEIESFIDCVKSKKSPIVSSKDGINALKYALQISNKIKR
tara:strand:+ start:2345 stop:3271 length:927 start_codon:yes stop_codon:yes gene_type:complete